jgi:hypothetical protein
MNQTTQETIKTGRALAQVLRGFEVLEVKAG